MADYLSEMLHMATAGAFADCADPLVEGKRIIGQSWVFKKTGSATKFKQMLNSLKKRGEGGEDWHPQISHNGLKVAVSSQGPMDQQLYNKLDALAAAHRGRREKTVHEDESALTEGVAQQTWKQLKQMKLNGFPLLSYLGAKNPTTDGDQLTVTLRGKWKGRVIIKLNRATDLYDLTFGRVRKYEWIVDSKVLGVEVGNLAHVLQRYVEYGEAKKKKTKKGKTITAGVEGFGPSLTEGGPPSPGQLKILKLIAKAGKKAPSYKQLAKAHGGDTKPYSQFAKDLRRLQDTGLIDSRAGGYVLYPGAKKLLEYEAADLDSWWSSARPKLIKGSKATRARRMDGCIKSLRSLRDGGVRGGQSQTHLNPVPKRERNSEDQPKDSTPGQVDEAFEENTMSLTDAINRFRDIEEANIPVPAPGRKGPDGAQKAAKSRFAQTNTAGTPPADAEPKQAATNSTAGVKGPGYDASGREYADVRYEHEAGYEFTQAEKGMGMDDFEGGGTIAEDEDDLAFADNMLHHPERIDGSERRLQRARMVEANIIAPKTGRSTPGGKQREPKSRFRKPYKGPGQDIYGPKGIPSDKEAQAAAERSTAGVSGPGYGSDGREEVDVRYEDASQRRAAPRKDAVEDADVGAFDPTQLDYPGEMPQ